MSSNLRPELEPLPVRMAGLPVYRGYPVPWFVEWIKDENGDPFPEFRAMNPRNWVRAIKEKLCWVCGHKLGANLAFVIGPMCGVTRTTSEPPCHMDCALWSARNCPFLSKSNMVRRKLENDYPDVHPPPGYHIERNPGVTLVWVTRSFKLFDDGKGQPLIEVGEPDKVAFFAEGRPAVFSQVEESVATGLPLLMDKTISAEDEREIHSLLTRFWAIASIGLATGVAT